MNLEITTSEAQKFIDTNLKNDVHKIILSKPRFKNITQKELVEQIESKLKAKTKLPTWYKAKNIYYPNKLNLSQTSSEITANYKASLVEGDILIDVTGGFGVDSLAFSKKVNQVFHIEKNKTLSKIADYNFTQMGISNIKCVADDGLTFLNNTSKTYNWLYIDPSRRDKDNKKVYYLSDCEPNVVSNMDLLLSKSSNLIIKTGPLLDIKSGLKELNHVKEIHIIAINNDVKEILWLIEKDFSSEAFIKTMNFKSSNVQQFNFYLSDEVNAIPKYSEPLSYIYEPNASILKSGSFQYLGNHFNLNKIHPNSHLYTSEKLIEFPGRTFKVEHIYDYSKKSLKKSGIKKANITTRNFPDSVAEIRKKLALKDGGKNYLFCTTKLDGNLIVISSFQI
ncbi:class I SAM-dependent methyltransferase [Maribacter sp. SA7]|uniref:THUMP-like domain-containing protein n=1 Tax=Maribacter zhoushanensis TaxID=3030012 RepID=UPI0023EDB2CE|nr:class I SAM-dependent methyltransferase [Maribacter zhoushanensis]MDF4204167.1 class I SAM-dependent methyltransferase [Maribacter zhoushanensis]